MRKQEPSDASRFKFPFHSSWNQPFLGNCLCRHLYKIQGVFVTLKVKVKHSAFAMFSYFLFQFCLKCAACHYTFRFLPALRVVSWPATKKTPQKSLLEVVVVTLIVIIIIAVSGLTEHCSIFHFPLFVRSSSITEMTYQLFSIFGWFRP